MSSIVAFILILLAVLAALAGFVALVYNRLVKARIAYQTAFSQIDVQLKRRYDLIPNLVESAKGYLGHERETLEAVIQARNQASQARQSASGDPSQAAALQRLTQADGALGEVLGRLMMVVESYPELKADKAVKDLMSELSDTENLIGSARSSFNQQVKTYNQDREVFPAVLFASFLGFAPATLWSLPDPAQGEAPRFSLASRPARP
jgi:LemA protein